MRKRNAKGRKPNCSKCKKEIEPSRRGKYSYCKSCHAEYMRKTRPRHSDLTPVAKMKANARAYLNEYLKREKVKKLPCEVCSNIDSQAHHDDYSKPLEVKWLCRDHHLELHGFAQA